MRKRNLSSFEVRPDAQDRYMRWVGEDLDSTVWARGGCRSWYLDDSGRPSLMWPRTMRSFRRMLRRFDPEHYLLRPAREAWREAERGGPHLNGRRVVSDGVLVSPEGTGAKSRPNGSVKAGRRQ
jgi:hypothetical protein